MAIEKAKHDEIVELLNEASIALNKARDLAGDTRYYWEGPAYGMGGWIASGEWEASSHGC